MVIIDFHSHVLPGLDDGSKDINMSLNMLKLAESHGTQYICATHHYIPDEWTINKENYDEKYKLMEEVCEDNNINIKILRGLELYMHPKLTELYENGEVWGINNTRYVLVEFPMRQVPLYSEEVFYELRLKGAIPIIAHPERNHEFMKDEGVLIKFINEGCLAQINAGSLRGDYGKNVQKVAETFVKRNLVHVVGSDAHNDGKRRTGISDEMQIIKKLNKDLFDWMCKNHEEIIHGKEIEILNIKANKKSIFDIFKA